MRLLYGHCRTDLQFPMFTILDEGPLSAKQIVLKRHVMPQNTVNHLNYISNYFLKKWGGIIARIACDTPRNSMSGLSSDLHI